MICSDLKKALRKHHLSDQELECRRLGGAELVSADDSLDGAGSSKLSLEEGAILKKAITRRGISTNVTRL